MPRIKVLHVITRLDLGGSSENTLLTVLNLDKARYAVTLVSGLSVALPAELMARVSRADVRLIEIKQLRRNPNVVLDFIAWYKILRLIRQEKYTIVHTHTSKAGVLGRLAAILARVPIIIHTPHGHIFYGYYNFFISRLIILVERVCAAFTHRLITLTQLGKIEHIQLAGICADKIVPIYSGIELEKMTQASPIETGQIKNRLGLTAEDLIVGVIARLVKVKGHDYFLQAAAKVKQVLPQARFLLIGDGPLKKNLTKQALKLGVNKEVIFTGNYADIRPLITILDLLVLPSLNEGMGRVLLQAQAQGKPVVATKVGGIPELVQDNQTGLLVPAKDATRLAQAVISLLQDEQKRHRMGEQARNWLDQRFSAQTMITQIERLYEQLLREKGIQFSS